MFPETKGRVYAEIAEILSRYFFQGNLSTVENKTISFIGIHQSSGRKKFYFELFYSFLILIQKENHGIKYEKQTIKEVLIHNQISLQTLLQFAMFVFVEVHIIYRFIYKFELNCKIENYLKHKLDFAAN